MKRSMKFFCRHAYDVDGPSSCRKASSVNEAALDYARMIFTYEPFSWLKVLVIDENDESHIRWIRSRT
jgi:hypothetical protein